MPTPKQRSFYDVLTAAINDMTEHGFDSAERVNFWVQQLKEAASSTLTSPHQMEQMLREAMAVIYRRMVDNGEIAKYHPGIARFTIERLRPALRAELDRRILASASLIKLNREQAIQKTLQRFQGWSTSIPKGGTKATDKPETKDDIRKSLASLPFEERRVLIDQGHKLRASLSEIVAKDGKALGMIWHSHWRQAGYDYREDHKERDGNFYALRGNWAIAAGLMKVGEHGYYDEITSVGEEPYCRCYAQWVYNIRDLPKELLTVKGASELKRVQDELRRA